MLALELVAVPWARAIVGRAGLALFNLSTRHYSADASRVVNVASDEDFLAKVKALSDSGKIGVVDFTAKWCGPCRAIAPAFDELSRQYKDVDFLKVDIDNDKLASTVTSHEITGVPTFFFYRGSQRVHAFSGARLDELKQQLTKLAGKLEI